MKNAKICLKDANRLLVMIGVMIMTVLLLSGCGKLQDQSPDPQLMQDAQTAQEAPQEAPAPTQEEPAEPEEEPQTPAQETEPASKEDPAQTQTGDDWKLILVNAEHPVPEGYSVTLKELRNDQWVDERIYPELQQMFDDARAEGIYPLINESYRSAERQQEILDNYIAAYEAEGLSTEEAQQRALEVVAKPGTSEHQLGLALDIIVEYEEDSTQTWQWLKENCWRYGFILRYPEDKTEITGISYEPWHFRYVGAEAAQQITERGITLEEYLEDKDAG
ncbi:MAG: D-alanyl-D-alanine carboxypeptidase family protein [Ruminococcaceae bacterium]|jgi:D-alanyl-D-alanine carboxypeptidase|nr:D-alanyl-D-alanine carboxypeptidase family protein [Oscillospiraceae bacterium]